MKEVRPLIRSDSISSSRDSDALFRPPSVPSIHVVHRQTGETSRPVHFNVI